MPFIAELVSQTLTNLVGEGPAEFFCPRPERLMRTDELSRRQRFLDHPQAERKLEIQPLGMGDDFGGKTMTPAKWISVRHGQAPILKSTVR